MNGDAIDYDWAVKKGLTDNPDSARKMFYRLRQHGILRLVWGHRYTWHKLTEQYSTKKNVPTTYVAANAKAGRQRPLHWSLQNVNPELRGLIPKDVLCTFQDSCEHLSQHHLQEDASCSSLPEHLRRPFLVNAFAGRLVNTLSSHDSFNHRLIRAIRTILRQPLSSPCTCSIASDRMCPYCSSLHSLGNVPAPPIQPRWKGYGALGEFWGIAGSACYDAIDRMNPAEEFSFHRPYFEFQDQRGECATAFERKPSVRNQCIRKDVTINYRGHTFSFHCERYLHGKVLLKPRLSESPLPLTEFPLLKRALAEKLSADTRIDAPPSETWQISSTDLNIDLPVKTKRRLSFTQPTKSIVLHHYTKQIGSQRYLRLEAQLNGLTMSITKDKELYATAKWVCRAILKSVGKRYDHNILL